MRLALLLGSWLWLWPNLSFAQGLQSIKVDTSNVGWISLGIFVVLSIAFSKLWIGVINSSLIHAEPIDSIETRKPFIATNKTVFSTVVGTILLFGLTINSGIQDYLPLSGMWSVLVIALGFVGFGLFSLFAEKHYLHAREYVFSIMMGTALAIIMMGFRGLVFGEALQNPYYLTLLVIGMVIAWKLLFGPWASHVKAAVLGTFLFWIMAKFMIFDESLQRQARLLATVIAIIPAFVWAIFFLKYHAQRLSLVLLMFFAGMLSTIPILFYDRLVKSGAELQFFLFKIVPENFTTSTSSFVNGSLAAGPSLRSTLTISLVSFLIVGFIEEFSKFWVMKSSGKRFFTSIDDVMQLSIIVAIGFAFAENVLNPSYFMSFVQQYLIQSDPMWGAFFGNILGRAILTNMVHIVSTGVMGYFFGLALFAGPILRDAHRQGRVFWLADGLHALLGYPTKLVFRRQMFLIGLTLAVVLHGMFNFLVTFPDLMPGNPGQLGDIFPALDNIFLGTTPLLLIPSLFYVVGGFWLLTELFYHKENMKERGHIVTVDTVVTQEAVA